MTQKNEQPYAWLTNKSRDFLNKGYLVNGQSPEDRIKYIAKIAAKHLPFVENFEEKFIDYMSKGYYSLASPVWSNYGLDRGLPISCFGSYISDEVESILYTSSEVGVMSKLGGGTSGYFGKIRPRGSTISGNGLSNGSFPFLRIFDTVIDVISQGSTRRGQFAGYVDIEHGDIEEWLQIQLEGNPIQLMFYGVCVGNAWLKSMEEGDSDKRKIWAKVLQCRSEIGAPYIMFKDNVNENTVDVYKNQERTIYASNLCSEIMLPSNEKESFVCCLSSMNMLHYYKWRDTDAVEILTYFLDAVMEEFIQKTKNIAFMERAHLFAKNHRALGLGVLGWHSLLQSKSLPFDSYDSMMLNAEAFSVIRNKAYTASKRMGEELGEPVVLKGYGRRNTTLMAVAPTKSSSFILGQVSQGIEPILSNYFVKDLAKSKTTYKNPMLISLLKKLNKDTASVWKSILDNDGSVQHLDFLSVHDKDINTLYLTAAKLGVKSLYYQHSVNAAREFKKNLLSCASCEG